jgi:hypothetical protein
MVYLGMDKDQALLLANLVDREASRAMYELDIIRSFQCQILLDCITVSLGKPINP